MVQDGTCFQLNLWISHWIFHCFQLIPVNTSYISDSTGKYWVNTSYSMVEMEPKQLRALGTSSRPGYSRPGLLAPELNSLNSRLCVKNTFLDWKRYGLLKDLKRHGVVPCQDEILWIARIKPLIKPLIKAIFGDAEQFRWFPFVQSVKSQLGRFNCCL